MEKFCKKDLEKQIRLENKAISSLVLRIYREAEKNKCEKLLINPDNLVLDNIPIILKDYIYINNGKAYLKEVVPLSIKYEYEKYQDNISN